MGEYLLSKGADPRLKNSRGYMGSEGISHKKAAFFRNIIDKEQPVDR